MEKNIEKIKVLYTSPLYLIANAIRYSHNNHHLADSYKINKIATCPKCNSQVKINSKINSDKIICESCNYETTPENHIGYKDLNLIKKIGFHMNHSSTLEHSLLVFDVHLSTKALLEWTRHRIGIGYTVTSSRYALDSMGIEFELTGDEDVDEILSQLNVLIKNRLKNASKKEFDKIAMALPQAFMYKMQVSFNLRALVQFLELRTSPSAHITIRKLAVEIIKILPLEYKELILENNTILKNYELFLKKEDK